MHFSMVPTGPPQQGKKGLMEPGALSAISSSIFFLACVEDMTRICVAKLLCVNSPVLLLHGITHTTHHACHRSLERLQKADSQRGGLRTQMAAACCRESETGCLWPPGARHSRVYATCMMGLREL